VGERSDTLNTVDWLIVLLLLVFTLIGFKRGLVRSLYHLFGWAIALYLGYLLYPVAARFLRQTELYVYMKNQIITAMDLPGLTADLSLTAQNALLDRLPASAFVLNHLQANNNPEAFKMLDASGLADYIGGYFANMAINLIALILVCIFVSIVMRVLVGLVDALANLPILWLINKTGGLALGLIEGVLVIWILMAAFSFFCLKPQYASVFAQIDHGLVSRFFFEYNPIMKLLVNVAG
jgi:uncharacterized membrane protein required for colicin V production